MFVKAMFRNHHTLQNEFINSRENSLLNQILEIFVYVLKILLVIGNLCLKLVVLSKSGHLKTVNLLWLNLWPNIELWSLDRFFRHFGDKGLIL